MTTPATWLHPEVSANHMPPQLRECMSLTTNKLLTYTIIGAAGKTYQPHATSARRVHVVDYNTSLLNSKSWHIQVRDNDMPPQLRECMWLPTRKC